MTAIDETGSSLGDKFFASEHFGIDHTNQIGIMSSHNEDSAMTYSFTTRAGMKFTGTLVHDLGHAVALKITKGRKVFVGKTLAFVKSDMGSLQIVEG